MSAPLEDGWIAWSGGECPVDPNALVEILVIIPGETEPRILFRRRAWMSMWDGPFSIAYRVVES